MRAFLLSLLILTLMPLSSRGAVEVMRRDLKLPSQKMIEMQLITDPAVANTAGGFSAHAGATSAAAVTISTFLAQPSVPRNVLLTPGGTTGDVESCVVTVTGTNIYNATITETLTFAANASTATTGAKAFKTVSSVAFPADCESGGFAATWSLGYGEKLGLDKCLDYAGDLIFSEVAGVYETTRATVVADDDEVEKNTADFNGTMNGSADFRAFYIQNYRCKP